MLKKLIHFYACSSCCAFISVYNSPVRYDLLTSSIEIKQTSNARSTKLKPEKDKLDQWKVTDSQV